jgi:carbonic anhydrase
VRALKLGIAPVLNQIDGDLEQRAAIANVHHSVEQLKRAKPILAAIVSRNDVRVVGGVYDLATDNVTLVHR